MMVCRTGRNMRFFPATLVLAHFKLLMTAAKIISTTRTILAPLQTLTTPAEDLKSSRMIRQEPLEKQYTDKPRELWEHGSLFLRKGDDTHGVLPLYSEPASGSADDAGVRRKRQPDSTTGDRTQHRRIHRMREGAVRRMARWEVPL